MISIGRLDINSKEHDYQVSSAAEFVDLWGVETLFYQVDVLVRDRYRDPEVRYMDPVPVDVLFDEDPRPILKSHGWLTETGSELPFVIYVPMKDRAGRPLKVTDDCKVILQQKHRMTEIREFTITRVTGNHLMPMMWICKALPYREAHDFDPNTAEVDKVKGIEDEKGTNYLKVDI